MHPDSGEIFTLGGNGEYAMPFPRSRHLDDDEPERDGTADLASGNWHTESPATVALIPATSENVAALAEIRARLRLLRERLANVLAQDSIATVLADLTSHLPLLK